MQVGTPPTVIDNYIISHQNAVLYAFIDKKLCCTDIIFSRIENERVYFSQQKKTLADYDFLYCTIECLKKLVALYQKFVK